MNNSLQPADILVPEGALHQRVAEIAAAISRDYEKRHLDIICTLGGAVVFFADLVRRIQIPMTHHYLGFSGHGRGSGSGEVRVTLDVAAPLEGRHVLVIEGAVVSGRTPRFVLDTLQLRRPASLALCALVVKRQSVAVELPLSYVGFEFGPQFVTGYGIGAHWALPHLIDQGAP